MVQNLIFLLLCRHDYRIEPEDLPPTPALLSTFFALIALIVIWWESSARIDTFRNHNYTISKSDLKIILKYFILDIKENPRKTLGCLGILIIYYLLRIYNWIWWILIGVGIVAFLLYYKLKLNK